MNETPQHLDLLLPAKLPAPLDAEAYAPSNIALSKYWGKRDAALNLPLNSSLSISLREWGTTTRVAPSQNGKDELLFQGEELDANAPFAAKIIRFVDLVRRGQDVPLRIETTNTIPTAAGLASSASGFAALAKALNDAFALNLSEPALSALARIGSGSASRSLWHGFVKWQKGEAADGSDSHGVSLDLEWREFRIAIIPVDTGPKEKSSRDGMEHTRVASPLFASWPAQAERDCGDIHDAVLAKDFQTLGALAEANAIAMHATMFAARPSLSYLKPETWAVLETLWKARRDGLQAFATMDAGANVKLIFLEAQQDDIGALFPKAQLIEPFKSLG
ncbi:MAG: diphosphomevalonate decarboxylase [Pseudomonadota bacterium]